MPHTIRLRHPWQCQACDGGARWQRTFNWPATLTNGETACLVVKGLPASAKLNFNDQPLAPATSGQYDITQTLARYNQLAIEIPSAEPSAETECPYEVSLQIVEP